MLQYIIKKIGYSIVVFLGVVTVIFFLFNILPGDSSRMLMGQRSDLQSLQAIRAELGLDQSFSTRYFKYLDDLSPLSVYSKHPQSYFYYNTKNYKKFIAYLLKNNLHLKSFNLCSHEAGATEEKKTKFADLLAETRDSDPNAATYTIKLNDVSIDLIRKFSFEN